MNIAKAKAYRWVFKGMKFSKNINGWTLYEPSIVLTFSSNICIIPDRLLPSRACFRLYRQCKDNTIYSITDNKKKKQQLQVIEQKKLFL